MLDARSSDWVRTARAKGLREGAVVRRRTVWLAITVVVVSAVVDVVVRALDPRLTDD